MTAYGNALRKASQVFSELAEAWDAEYGQATATNPVAVPEPAQPEQPAQNDPWQAPQGPVPPVQPAPVPAPAPVPQPASVPPVAVQPVAPQPAPQRPAQGKPPIPTGIFSVDAPSGVQSWTLGAPNAPQCHCGNVAAYVSGPDKNGKPFASWRCAYGADKAAGLRFQDKCNYFARA